MTTTPFNIDAIPQMALAVVVIGCICVAFAALAHYSATRI
jgi:hypothetical protein